MNHVIEFVLGVAFWLAVFRIARRIKWKVGARHGK